MRRFGLVLLFTGFTSLATLAQERRPGIIDTLAGTGQGDYTGDDGPAVKATLNQPFHVEYRQSPSGKVLYIAEAFNHLIRKVDLATGKISTIAGSGRKGYDGDGGPARQAAFNEPYAVVADDNDNLYIVDRLNAAIRRVDGQTGMVTTIAGTGKKGSSGDGGPGSKAQMVEPNDCCLDGKGGLLIADVGDWRIRRLDLKTGTITTFAGTGRPKEKGKVARDKIGDGGQAAQAILVGARAVCVDGKGNAYVCEREGSSIRKIDAAGVITTIGGTGENGGSGDGGDAKLALFKGPKGIRADRMGNLYVVDTENHSIRRIDARTNVVTTVAGGRRDSGGDGGPATQAGMDRPHGCIVDPQGVLYVADSNNHRVRVVKLP